MGRARGPGPGRSCHGFQRGVVLRDQPPRGRPLKDKGVTGRQLRACAAVELESVEPGRKGEFAVAADARALRVDLSARLVLEESFKIALDLVMSDQGSVRTPRQQDRTL